MPARKYPSLHRHIKANTSGPDFISQSPFKPAYAKKGVTGSRTGIWRTIIAMPCRIRRYVDWGTARQYGGIPNINHGIRIRNLAFALPVGTFFGVQPARRTTRLHPHEALRYKTGPEPPVAVLTQPYRSCIRSAETRTIWTPLPCLRNTKWSFHGAYAIEWDCAPARSSR